MSALVIFIFTGLYRNTHKQSHSSLAQVTAKIRQRSNEETPIQWTIVSDSHQDICIYMANVNQTINISTYKVFTEIFTYQTDKETETL